MTSAYIYEAVRSPRGHGREGGSLSSLTPQALVAQLINAVEVRHPGMKDAVSSLTLGCVGQVKSQGGHIAMVSRLHAGLADTVRPLTINNFCVSGLSAIRLAGLENQGLHLAGGVEMMSAVPFLADRAPYYGDMDLARRYHWAPVGLAADLMATREGFSAEDLNAASVRSHTLAAASWAKGGIGEVVTIKGEDGYRALAMDETIRPGTNMETLEGLTPVFAEPGKAGFDHLLTDQCSDVETVAHIHTIAHCPPIADGAALALIGSKSAGAASGLKPKAKIRAMVELSGDPLSQLTSGFAAMEALLDQTGLTLADFDRIEFMEAFAATIVKFERDYQVDMAKVNADGGHLALGHPMGASGAMLTASLLGGLERSDGSLGLVVATGGSGVGVAMAVERV